MAALVDVTFELEIPSKPFINIKVNLKVVAISEYWQIKGMQAAYDDKVIARNAWTEYFFRLSETEDPGKILPSRWPWDSNGS